MSKYIRTEYRIFKLDEFGCIRHPANGMRIHKSYIENLREADTIEELCDEFIWVTPEGEHRIKPKKSDGLWWLCCSYKNKHSIYGAIWTDKGLIYVAKTNEKGELELI